MVDKSQAKRQMTYIVEWGVMVIFSNQWFFEAILGPEQLCRIWDRLVASSLSASRLKFVWKLVWENVYFCISTTRGFSSS